MKGKSIKNSAVEWDKYFLSMKESFLNRYFVVLYFISTVLSSCIAYVLFSVFEFQNPLLKTILLAIVCIVLSIKRYKAKEYDEIAAQNKKDNDFDSSDEFLSNFKKTDRLHPVISLCVYYGEREWDGPLSLKDMLKIPEELEAMIADYKMNLIQVRSSESLKFCNSDVNTVFDVSRAIYARDYKKINMKYKDQAISTELGLVIGAITESQQLIDHALELEQKGGRINMCNALEELRQEGIQEGRLEGIRVVIQTCKDFNVSRDAVVKKLMKDFALSEEEAFNYVSTYW